MKRAINPRLKPANTNKPSPPKNDFAPPNLVSTWREIVARQVRTRLHHKSLILHLDSRHVAGRSRREGDLARAAARRKRRNESRFAADRAFQCAENAAFNSECRSTFADIETIAPASAAICCSGWRLMTAKANAP
jgi:hypothetical protein